MSEGSESPEVSIDDQCYDSLESAIAATGSNVKTIKLLSDVARTAEQTSFTIPEGSEITIDLNGHSITGSIKGTDENYSTLAVISNEGTLTIIDSSDELSGSISNDHKDAHSRLATIRNAQNATLTIEGGTISAMNGCAIANYGVCNIYSGVIKTTGGATGGWINGTSCVDSRNTLNIDLKTGLKEPVFSTVWKAPIYSTGNTAISCGTFSSEKWDYLIYLVDGKISVTGGKWAGYDPFEFLPNEYYSCVDGDDAYLVKKMSISNDEADNYEEIVSKYNNLPSHTGLNITISSDVRVAGNLIIPRGSSLVIPVGYTLTLPTNTSLIIEGKLVVSGTLSLDGGYLGNIDKIEIDKSENITGLELSKNEDGVYLISTPADLQLLSSIIYFSNDNFSNQTIKLTRDLDMSGYSFNPIGTSKNNFKGTFDGNNHIIKNLSIHTIRSNTALFSEAEGATFKNIHLSNCNFKTDYGEIGFIVAHCNISGTFENIYVDERCSTTNSSSYYSGGICGALDNSTDSGKSFYFINCSNHGNVTGLFNVGSMWGTSSQCISKIYLINCSNYGTILATGDTIGIAGGFVNIKNTVYIYGFVNNGNVLLSGNADNPITQYTMDDSNAIASNQESINETYIAYTINSVGVLMGYTTIYNAINESSDGDIVNIFNGEYEEVTVSNIDNSISIIGNNSTIKGISLSFASENTPNISISNVNFTGKGLFISGANDVTITGCKFTNITGSVVADDPTQVNAIYLEQCTGDVKIGGVEDDKNIIKNVSSDFKPSQYGRGIFISYGGSGKSLTIQNNSISGTAYNALQLSNIEFTTITISNNEINNWDSDNDGAEDTRDSPSKGRAIRLNVSEYKSKTLTISDNKFTKTYGIGILYDNYNIIKVTDGDDSELSTTLTSNEAVLSYESKDTLPNGLVIDASKNLYVTFPSLTESENSLNINIEINKVNFTGKGLFISGANDVTVTGCTFTDISSGFEKEDLAGITPNMYHPAAIHVQNSSGNVLIEDNTVNGVNGGAGVNKKFMGISITNPKNTNSSSIEIKDNDIRNVDHNAIYIFGSYFSISITDKNEFSEWDKNNDSVNSSQNKNFAGGRAIRIDVKCESIIISENTFIKNYLKTSNQNAVIFGSDLGGSDADSNIGYDDGNILKASTDAKFTNNVLRLTGIADYSGDKLFKFDDDNTRFLVTFNANGGYFKDSSKTNELLYSITENGVVDEPTDPSRLGSYSFAGWYTDSTLTAPFTDFTVPITGDKTLYAKWTYTGGSGGYPVNPPVTPDEPEEPIIPDSSGNAEIKVDDKKADELVHETVASGSNTLNIVDKDNVEGTVTSVSISVSDLETISKKIENNNNIDSISIATSEGEVIIEKEVLAEILENNAEADTLIIEVDDAKDKLTEEQKKTAGDNPVYDINLRLGDKYVTSFNGKSITVSIPYELKEGEDQNNLIVYYLKDDGSIEKMNCSYKDN
uniref:InlB B-repeat-containing protein n=1 Tax=Candidatus Methanomassiliicoccus intestinalis TaxID=1406512 RepID=UPI0037DBF8B9